MAFLDITDFKSIIPSNVIVYNRYIFDPTNKKIEIVGLSKNIQQIDIFAILNVTAGEVIYNPFDSGKYGQFLGNTVSLEYDTTSMSSSDSIYIYILDLDKDELNNTIASTLSNIESIISNQNIFINNLLT